MIVAKNVLKEKIRNFLPAYFAMIMATGIVSIAFFMNLLFLLCLFGVFVYRFTIPLLILLGIWKHVKKTAHLFLLKDMIPSIGPWFFRWECIQCVH